MEPQTNQDYRWLNILLLLVVIAACAALLVVAIQNRLATGLLKVSSTNKQAALSVSQDGRSAAAIGTGQAKVRLKPGTYEVAAAAGGSQSAQTVTVSKQQPASITIDPTRAYTLPSVKSVNFNGIYALINGGLSTEQANKLKLAFFKFKPAEKTVDIIPSSAYALPHDPNVDTSFSTKFAVTIDATSYNALISYSSISAVQLQLFDQQGNQVFDSGGANSQPPSSGE